ncbi:MAG: sulfatase-like hydrolase/transferase [Gammaproteobacteria bacterium]
MVDFDARFVGEFFIKFGCALVFTYPCMVLLFNTTPLAIDFEGLPSRTLVLFSGLIFFAIIGLGPRKVAGLPSRRLSTFWIAVFALCLPFALLKMVMGDNQIEPILIFLSGDNLGELIAVGKGSYALLLGKAFGFFGAFGLALVYLVRRYAGMKHVVNLLCAALIALHPVTDYIAGRLFPNELQDGFDPRTNIVEPVNLTRPARPRNLVIVYLESLEATFERLPETAAGFATINALRDTAFNADNIYQVEGTRYTIAGIVATQCGVPLIPYGLNNIGFDHYTENSLNSVMPNVVCLGDVLARDGYTVSYMNGASLERYSKRGFLNAHGYTRMFGLESVDERAIAGNTNVFGMNDGVLFEHVYTELDTLRQLGKPFLLSILTVGTHGPDGFRDRDCPIEDGEAGGLTAAIRCTGDTLRELFEYLERTDLADSTLVAVMSDHLVINRHLDFMPAMNESMSKMRNERRNLFFIRGIEPRRNSKPGAMIDVYPTLLEALGYELKENRANLGVSLFGEQLTLVETYGVRGVNKLFLQNIRLAGTLWRD